MRPSLTTTVSNFLQDPFVSFEEDRTWPGSGETRAKPNRSYRGNIQTFVKRFLAATCRNRPRQIGWRGKKRDRAFGVSVYVPRWLLRRKRIPFVAFCRIWQTLSRQFARKISLLRDVMKRRGYVRKQNGETVKRDNS